MSGYLTTFLQFNQALPQRIQAALATKVDYDGAPLTAEREAEIRDDIPNAAIRSAEFKTLTLQPPTVTVEGTTRIDLGNRIVEIRYLGRGNTGGDVVVWLPHERIVAAGDLLVYPFPFLLGGFPSEWSRTLDRLAELGAATIVPGHGAVLSGDDARAYTKLVADLLRVVSSAVQSETFARDNGPGNLAAVTAAVVVRPEVLALRQRFVARNADLGESFDGALKNLIASSYRESWGG
jgi:glyoxylase-like metal-dependent hydrolase (beta-lactamase superfamily II)